VAGTGREADPPPPSDALISYAQGQLLNYKFISKPQHRSHIVWTVGSEMAVRLSAPLTGRTLLPRNIIFFPVLISVRG
jgi:hypothetical protein